MSMSCNLHANPYSHSPRELKVRAKLQINGEGEYAVLGLQVYEGHDKQDGGEFTLFASLEQIADIRFQLDQLLEEYTTKNTIKVKDIFEEAE